MFNSAWWGNMSDELKGFLVTGLAVTTIILTLVLTNFVFNIVAVRSGLHQQSDQHNDHGWIWVK